MGCTSSSSVKPSTSNASSINFKNTGVDSLDDFFGTATTFLTNFQSVTSPLSTQKDNFFDETDMYKTPGAGKDKFLKRLRRTQACFGWLVPLPLRMQEGMFTTRHNRSYRVMSTQWALSSTIGEM
jgi:hypothetical protein